MQIVMNFKYFYLNKMPIIIEIQKTKTMINIKGKYALITGSSRGVGQQIAMGLAEKGCNIIVHGRTAHSCVATLGALEKYKVKSYMVFGDLSEKGQVENLVKQVEKLQISVDILYNNAAIMVPYQQNIWNHSWDAWIETFKVNVIAMYDLCAAFIPDMIKNNFGRVINLTSRIMHQPGLAPYGASKWALDKLTDDIASTLQHTGVRINMLDPTWLQTDMGGASANNPVTAVLPGALVPALIDDNGPNGQFFSALEYDKSFFTE